MLERDLTEMMKEDLVKGGDIEVELTIYRVWVKFVSQKKNTLEVKQNYK